MQVHFDLPDGGGDARPSLTNPSLRSFTRRLGGNGDSLKLSVHNTTITFASKQNATTSSKTYVIKEMQMTKTIFNIVLYFLLDLLKGNFFIKKIFF